MNIEYLYRLALNVNTEVFYELNGPHPEPLKNHALRVSNSLNDYIDKIVALLHDVLEQEILTERDLLDFGFPKEIVEIVVILTKKENESYDSYIERIMLSKNKIALRVKKADLVEHANEKTTSILDDKSRLNLINRYRNSYYLINEALNSK